MSPNDNGRYAQAYDDNDVDMDAHDNGEPTHDNNLQGTWDDQANDDNPEDEMLMNEEIEDLQEDL
jgi:hypothetical protein